MSDQNEKNRKIAALQGLSTNDGWKVLVEELKGDIAITEAKLFGDTKLAEDETIAQLQRERIDRIELINLPDNLIKELYEDEESEVDMEAYEGYTTQDVLTED